MTKDHYILTCFGWTPPNDKLFGEKWLITKENGTLKLENGKTTREITEKEIIDAVYWKSPEAKHVSEKELPDFITWEGFCWLAPISFSHNISIKAEGTIPIFTTAYFIHFRDALYDILKEREKLNK